jgi:membrane fusion protein, heavy metal efflux system
LRRLTRPAAETETSVERSSFVRFGSHRNSFKPDFHLMLVDQKPTIIDAPPHCRDDKPGDPQPVRRVLHPATILALVAVTGAVGAGAYHLHIGPFARPAPAPAAIEKMQPFIRAGQRITVPEGSPVRTKLVIQPVEEQDIQRRLVLPAVVEADPSHLIKVLPPLAGRATQLKVQLGERVRAGQPLVVIDSPDLTTAYADYDRAKVLMSLALKNRNRQRILGKDGWTDEKDLQQVETDYLAAEVELQRAGARRKKIGVDAETPNKSRNVTVVAPMAGSVIDLGVAPGAFWNDVTAPLMTIADLSTVWVTASVPEKDTSLVSKGQLVDVIFDAYPGEVFKGHVLFVSDVLDPDTRRTKVRIAFDNPNTRLKPGMFANVSFYAPMRRVPVVPTSALVVKDDANQVLVETEPWTFEARTVDIDFQQGDQVVLKGGVKAGDRIVAKGGVLLGD